MGFYGTSSKTQLMERDVKTSETLLYLTMLQCCQIMFGTRRDRVSSLNALLCQVLRKIV